MRQFLTVILCILFIPVPSLAQNSFVVSNIELEGVQRVSPGSIFGLLDISVGDEITQQDISQMVQDIYASDFFEDIEVLRDGNVLIIRVQERPSISNIEIEGSGPIPEEALLGNMENAGLSIGNIFDRSTLAGLSLALQDQYIGQGLYGVEVDVEVIEQPRNRVEISININVGDPSKIVHINIVGNTVFDDDELLDLFELRTTHFTSFFRKDDRYSRERINGDLERLVSYYQDQGYINFEVTSTQVSVSPDRSQVYITVNVSEGEIYTVADVELAGNLVGAGDLLRRVIQVRENQVFSQQLVTSTSEFMTQLLTNRGYFFAEVTGVPSIDEESRTVDITFFVDPGSRTYINRITFFGNSTTVDEVLRRELRQMEGAPASTVALEQSKVRLERLGYFSEVEYETNQVPGTSDQIDVDFTVEEQNSGTITGSIGYAQVQGLIFSASLQQNNFLGTGTRVGVSANHSRFQTSYNFNYFDPYYTIDGVSRGFSIGYNESDYAELNLASYSTNQVNGSINYGYQVSEVQSMSFNFGYSRTQIDSGFSAVQEIKSSPELIPGINRYIVEPLRSSSFIDPVTGQIVPIANAVTAQIDNLPDTAFNEIVGFLDREGDLFNNFTVSASWGRSTLNRGIFPTAGSQQSLSVQITVPGSDLEFYKINFYNDIYFPIYDEWIIHNRLQLGYGNGYGDTEQLPFFQNYYAGGLQGQGVLRGFEQNTLGPRATPPAEYLTQPSQFVTDGDGNIQFDIFGTPLVDQNSQAYQLTQATDANGELLFDESGQPVYETRLNRRFLYAPSLAAPFGGNIQAIGTVELLFPLPFIEDRSQVRSAFFVDGGNVFSSHCTSVQIEANNCTGFDASGFRYSAGISVSWLSGFGPMTFSFSKAFNASAIDETESFQFTIGNTF